MLTDIQAVRLKTGDKSIITREVARGNSNTTIYKLSHEVILTIPVPQVWVNNVLMVEFADFTINYEHGIISFNVPPPNDEEVIFQYYWAVYNNEEVQYFLDESGGNTTFAASKLLYALAADAAKVAMRETLAGGSSFGSITKDTSLTAQELRETAKALQSQYLEEEGGANAPVDGLTEVPWTEQTWSQIEGQHLVRDNVL